MVVHDGQPIVCVSVVGPFMLLTLLPLIEGEAARLRRGIEGKMLALATLARPDGFVDAVLAAFLAASALGTAFVTFLLLLLAMIAACGGRPTLALTSAEVVLGQGEGAAE